MWLRNLFARPVLVLAAAATFAVALLVGAPDGSAEPQTEGGAPASQDATQTESDPEAQDPALTEEPMEEIPEGIEIMEGSGYRYEARGRRDPFVSLALGINVLPPEVRPPGLAGMLIQEVSLRGIVKTVDGYIAMIQGTDNKSYFAREGERLYDGHIQAINDQRVVFRQEINDPLRIEKFQQVEKSLYPVEEGNR
jgi:Tfp pilus assembly protein PilP